jgi:Ca2+-transporting ATPase
MPPGTAEAERMARAVSSAWARTVPEIYHALGTGEGGLTDGEAQKRFRRFGPNEFRKRRGARGVAVLADQFSSPLIFMLVGAALITVFLREWMETAIIALAVIVNTGLGFYQEYKAENTLEKLTGYIKERTRITRGGRAGEIGSAELVPGDVIHLSFGARVPADARLVMTNNFSVDEAVLTGESLPVRKGIDVVSEGASMTDRSDMIFAGSLAAEGYASAVVVATGERTEIGRIARLVSEVRREPTPLQRSLRSLAWILFAAVIIIVSGLFFLGLSRGEPILQMLLLSVATAVGAIPEALPIALTVILTVGVERLAGKKGIMRSLGAAETLGSTTLVMTDKTGTLTQANMRVTAVLTKKSLIGDETHEPIDLTKLSPAQKALLDDAFLCTDAVAEDGGDGKSPRFLGRPLEVNIAFAAHEAGVDTLAVVRDRRRAALPFNSTNKFSVTFDRHAETYTVLGAPDILLARSAMSKDEYLAIESRIKQISAAGGRIVGLARLKRAAREVRAIDPKAVQELDFLGVIVLYDPPRPEAADALKRIRAHGAAVVMVTGDLKGTAQALAREIGWEVTEAGIMTGEEVRQFSDEEFSLKLPSIQIFARVTPEDKLRIGRLYQARGEIVAMTGDGVNDAPALKAADIGIAIGSGSDVAKSAADLVLLDDDFKTIVSSIEEGKRIIANVRKSFVYLMSNCLDEVFLIGGSLIFALPLPLSAIQIIWVNFFTGSLPALSYAFEENRDVSRGKAARDAIFNTPVRVLISGIGVATSVLLFALYWMLLSLGVELDIARTVLFLCFSSYILVVAFCFKSLHRPLFRYPLFDNRALNISILIAAALAICSIAVPPLRETLELVPVSFAWIALVFVWLAFNMLLVEAAKWMLRRATPRAA